MTTSASYPRLVADIGGTHARFGVVRAPGDAVEAVRTLQCRDHDGPVEAVRAYLDGLAAEGHAPAPVKIAAFAVATAITGDRVRVTNSAWAFSQIEVRDRLELLRLDVINDFEALAHALPGLPPSAYHCIGAPLPDGSLPMAVLGPGTGLGVATVVPSPSGWIALPGEGGHATLAPVDDFDDELLRAARTVYPHVSAERFLSGIGLPVLYRAVCAVRGETPVLELGSTDISRRGVASIDVACTQTLEAFCGFLGSFAGNVALTVGSRGGVFLSGGIVPQLGEFFARSRFRERFEAKGRFTAYLASIATALIVAPHVALAGAARAMDTRAWNLPSA